MKKQADKIRKDGKTNRRIGNVEKTIAEGGLEWDIC